MRSAKSTTIAVLRGETCNRCIYYFKAAASSIEITPFCTISGDGIPTNKYCELWESKGKNAT